ncbi:MAG TPA: hypothetical protein VHU77_00330 [Candidatus Limnocylindria bacterium]|nr:hypothetical protein [Candidatus Limnocylindria bacterium]
MRRLMVLSLCALLLLAGCARLGSGGASSDEPSAGTSGEPPIAIPDPLPPSPNGDGSQRVEPDATVFDAHDVSIDHVTIGPDARSLAVYWWGGNAACFGLKEVRVGMQRGTPIITVLEGTREAARDRMCTMEAVLKSALVTLDAPIVVDAANSDPEGGEAKLPERAKQVHVTEGLVDASSNAVISYRLGRDGSQLDAYYVGGVEDCYGLAAADVDRQGSGPLQVSVREGRKPGAGACDDIGVLKFVRVQLAEPLVVVAALDSGPGQPAH